MGQQQQFGLPSSQMNAPSQHPAFHDQQGGQQNQAQMSANFGNVGMTSSTQLQANINGRPSLQALGPNISRQIEMLNLAQNQQHQNPQLAPPTYVTRMAQHQQQQVSMNGQPGQNQGQPLFGSQPATDVNRGSPPHPAQLPGTVSHPQGAMQSNPQGLPAGRRPMTYLELRDRATQLRSVIAKHESMAAALSQSRASIEQGVFLNRMALLGAEIKTRRDLLTKVVQAMNTMAPQGQNTGNPNGSQGGNPGNL